MAQPPSHITPTLYTGDDTSLNHPRNVVEKRPAHEYAANLIGMDEATMERRLAALGPGWFIDMMSVGYLVEELAMSVGVRISVLQQWLNRNVTQDVILKAKEHAAAYYRIKAVREVENRTPADRTELGLMKLRIDTFRDVAEAMNPKAWAPNPNTAPGLGVANVTINMPSGRTLGGVQQFGPGIEPLPERAPPYEGREVEDAEVIPDPNPDPSTLPPPPTPEQQAANDDLFAKMNHLLSQLSRGESDPPYEGGNL